MGLCGSSVRGPITIRSFSPVDHKDTNTPQHAMQDKQFLYFVPFCSCVFLAKKGDGVGCPLRGEFRRCVEGGNDGDML